MTTEQREAIERLKDDIKHAELRDAVDDDCTVCFTEDVDTVLSLIKEQQEEIENLKNKEVLIKRYFQKCDLIKQKDKIIDLMSKQLAGLTIFDIEKDEPLILTDKEEVISYFANKVNSKIQ